MVSYPASSNSKTFVFQLKKPYANFDIVDFGFSTYDRSTDDRWERVGWKIVASKATFHELDRDQVVSRFQAFSIRIILQNFNLLNQQRSYGLSVFIRRSISRSTYTCAVVADDNLPAVLVNHDDERILYTGMLAFRLNSFSLRTNKNFRTVRFS